jgi:hypothetical protein
VQGVRNRSLDKYACNPMNRVCHELMELTAHIRARSSCEGTRHPGTRRRTSRSSNRDDPDDPEGPALGRDLLPSPANVLRAGAHGGLAVQQ